MIYDVVEPQLSEDEKVALDIIERAFEKLVSTNLEIIEGDRRTEYLRERFYSLVNIFGLKLSEHQKERMFFTLKRQYLGYSRIDTLMKDKYIEDISCNGSDIFLYVQHRIYGSIRYQCEIRGGRTQQLRPETRASRRQAYLAPPAHP